MPHGREGYRSEARGSRAGSSSAGSQRSEVTGIHYYGLNWPSCRR